MMNLVKEGLAFPVIVVMVFIILVSFDGYRRATDPERIMLNIACEANLPSDHTCEMYNYFGLVPKKEFGK